MYNDKGNTKYLKLLKQNYSSSQDVIKEIVNLSAIINLPKGTEFFLSDIHGEYEAFLHIMNNCSGVIKEKVDLIFKDTISDYDRQELCTLIYYPREKLYLSQSCSHQSTPGRRSERLCLRNMRTSSMSFCMRRRMRMQIRSDIISRY